MGWALTSGCDAGVGLEGNVGGIDESEMFIS